MLGLIDQISKSLNYALMGVITLTMYHLKLTLRYLTETDKDWSNMKPELIGKRLRLKEALSTALVCIATLAFATLLILSNYFDAK